MLDSNEIRVSGALEAVEAMQGKEALEKLSLGGNQLGKSGLKKVEQRMKQMGIEDRLGEMEDNEEPDSDEEDPDISDEEDEEETDEDSPQKSGADINAAFSFTPASATASGSSIFGGSLSKSSGSVFGGTAGGASTSLFGTSSSSPFKPAGNLFASSPSSIFSPSSTKSETPSIFSRYISNCFTPVF